MCDQIISKNRHTSPPFLFSRVSDSNLKLGGVDSTRIASPVFLSSLYTSSGHEELDILEERRQSGDLSHALRTFSPQPYKEKPPCSASDLSKRTLESQYLQYVFKESSLSMEEVKEDARLLLEEMSQNLQLGFIRLMGYTLSKVFKRLYTNIYVNMEGLNMLQQAIQESPVILMPTHRSYIDFLIISYVLFTYDIPVPVIAAGLPLAGMKLVGEILRRSGAFFIRRSIGSDKLYWAVLSEYVKTIVRTGFAPLEFFVEGLRSRTLKSVPPKLGMMHMVLEPYFKGEVFDITLVPISISYDRVLEESLLAHELLGIPKPKETTKGLFKATKVLQEDYGCMHVNFGQPLSVRELCQGKINRSQYNLTPRQVKTSYLKHLVTLTVCAIRIQEEGSYISPWSLMACVLLQCPTSTLTERGMVWSELKDRTLWLKKLALRFGAHLRWPDQNVLLSMVALHHSIVAHKGDRVCLVREEVPIRKHRLSAEEEVNRTAVAMLMLASYRNQSLHIFLRPAMLATVIQVTKSTQRDELFTFFCFLKEILSNEFIFVPGKSTQDFEEACFLMKDCGAILFSPEEVTVTEAGQEVVSFLCAFIQPFIRSYQVMNTYVILVCYYTTNKNVFPMSRTESFVLYVGELQTYEALSSDIQKNVLSALRTLGVLTKFRG
uniref:Phospholipid/glycerol acyltransferase domain-containing protein n=1 Tax=Periophthalmus magnuspinnatus TaxID=409849 RepID=A0A3B3Z892_9GOBI